LSQTAKNKIAANKTRARKKKIEEKKQADSSKPQWEISKKIELVEEPGRGGESRSSSGRDDPGDDMAVKEQLKKFEREVAERNRAVETRQEAEEKEKMDRWKKANERVRQATRDCTSNAGSRQEPQSGNDSPCDYWAEMLEAEEAEAEKEAHEEEGRRARQAACDAFEEELNSNRGQSGPRTTSTAAGTSSSVLPPATKLPERKWDLTMVEDLLDLAEAGEKVAWPQGLDTVVARKIFKEHQEAKRLRKHLSSV
jgi:hypothetical protein